MSTVSQRAFSSGELDPALHGRTDFNKYYTGLKLLNNFVVKKQGGIENRAGTRFVDYAPVDGAARVIPFDAGSGARYMLVFAENAILVIKDGAYLTSNTQYVTDITVDSSSPYNMLVTYSGADSYVAGDYVQFNDFPDADDEIGNKINGLYGRVVSVDTALNILEIENLAADTFAVYAFLAGGTVSKIVSIATTYLESELFDIQYAQSVDVMTLVHPSHPIKELSRLSDTSWTIATADLSGDTNAEIASSTASQVGVAGVVGYSYGITTVDSNGRESILIAAGECSVATGNATLSSSNWNKVEWTSTGSPIYYNVYRKDSSQSQYGFIGSSNTLIFSDIGYTPDFSVRPPVSFTELGSSDNYPSCVSYAQQRRFFANTNSEKETVWGSKTGDYSGFMTGGADDNESIKFRAANKKFNPVKHILDLSIMVLMTENGELAVNPDGSPILPTNINIKTQTYNGSSGVSPIVINDNALYVDSSGSTVRDLLFDYQVDGFSGNDISLFAKHLFDGYTIVDWCYQKSPDSIVWLVRSDGLVLSLTYLREQQVIAWARHNFSGNINSYYNGLSFELSAVESCASVRNDDNGEDEVYFVVKRSNPIEASTAGTQRWRYIERLSSRTFQEIKNVDYSLAGSNGRTQKHGVVDLLMVDAGLTYDGRNTDLSVTVTTTDNGNGTFNIEISDASFVSSLVGKQIHIGPNGYTDTVVKFLITDFIDTSNITCSVVNKPIDYAETVTATSDFGIAVNKVYGVRHLTNQAGGNPTVIADGFVVYSYFRDSGSSNPTDFDVDTGSITLQDFYCVIHVGLGYMSEMQTLNIDTSQGETLIDKKINIQKVTLLLNKTRGLSAGRDNDDDELVLIRPRDATASESYNSPSPLINGAADVVIESSWNSTGSVYVRQDYPLPANILSIHVSGYIPTRG